MEKDISIIIPIFKDAIAIGKTIDSVLHFFDTENLAGEIVVVNDGGEASGVQAVKEKMKNTDRIKLFAFKSISGTQWFQGACSLVW